MEDCASQGFVCCHGSCVNTLNDVQHCGDCDVPCEGDFPHCASGVCGEPPCADAGACSEAGSCCGSSCCAVGQLCCEVNVGPATLSCSDPIDGTCPKGCPECACAAPDTPIATPSGEVPIAELRMGDLVYSQDAHGIVVVPIRQVNRTPVLGHTVLEITLRGERSLQISPDHPDAEGLPLGRLAPGSWHQGVHIQSVRTVPYQGSMTYDVLPAGETGVYFAAGLPIGSTLGP